MEIEYKHRYNVTVSDLEFGDHFFSNNNLYRLIDDLEYDFIGFDKEQFCFAICVENARLTYFDKEDACIKVSNVKLVVS